MARQKGFEPLTRGLEGRCSSPSELLARWSGRLDSNQRPPAPKAGALPGCATPRHLNSTNFAARNLQNRVTAMRHRFDALRLSIEKPFRARYSNSDTKSKKAISGICLANQCHAFPAAAPMREETDCTHRQPTMLVASIILKCAKSQVRKVRPRWQKCESTALSKTCVKYRRKRTKHFRISRKKPNCRSSKLVGFHQAYCLLNHQSALLNLSPENRLRRLSPSWPG